MVLTMNYNFITKFPQTQCEISTNFNNRSCIERKVSRKKEVVRMMIECTCGRCVHVQLFAFTELMCLSIINFSPFLPLSFLSATVLVVVGVFTVITFKVQLYNIFFLYVQFKIFKFFKQFFRIHNPRPYIFTLSLWFFKWF